MPLTETEFDVWITANTDLTFGEWIDAGGPTCRHDGGRRTRSVGLPNAGVSCLVCGAMLEKFGEGIELIVPLTYTT